MGTMLQADGLPLGDRPELLNLTDPDRITAIHRAYIEAGAEIIYTNTFGANGHKLAGTGHTPAEVISAGVAAAKKAAGDTVLTALDIGPIGELLEPAGTLLFEEAYRLFAEQVTAGVEAGCDLIVIETMSDLYEAKAALLAAKEHSSLPVFVTLSFEETGRTFAGCGVDSMAVLLGALGADAIGINCSLGPREIRPILEKLAKETSLPLIVKANAGLPDPATGAYGVSAEEFANEMAAIADCGAVILGGCCGTTPAYLKALRARLPEKPCRKAVSPVPALCTATRTVRLNNIRVIGERINPTGKKRMQQALREGDFSYLRQQAVAQAEAGADILDINVGLPGIDEVETIRRAVRAVQSVTDLPLQIDSSEPAAIEAALRLCNGKPIVNSVNGKQESLHTVLPLVKKYGAAVVGLTLDENGIPPTAEERLAIARKILSAAEEYGIPKEDVLIDCLTLAVSVQQKEAGETLRAVRMVREELGLQTVLGVSNISFGLPERVEINRSFLTLALQAGLTLPILNPNIPAMMDTVAAFRVLSGKDAGAEAYLVLMAERTEAEKTETEALTLPHAVEKGLDTHAADLCRAALQNGDDPFYLINGVLIPALDRVGDRFGEGKLFLPQLLRSAAAATAAFGVLQEHFAKTGGGAPTKGPIVIATVEGDIHDIGKNIVRVILENYGYRMIDLGRDVPVQTVVDAVREYKAPLVGLSALMTTTLKSMEKTIRALHEAELPCKIFVGGAVLTPEYAEEIGADYYAKDAKASVDIAKRLLG